MPQPFTTRDDAVHAEYIPPVNQEWPENDPPKSKGFADLKGTTKLKLVGSISLDALGLGIGWMPGLGHLLEPFKFAISCAMWGKHGAWSAWEFFEVTNMVDSFIPTHTLIAWYAIKQELAEG